MRHGMRATLVGRTHQAASSGSKLCLCPRRRPPAPQTPHSDNRKSLLTIIAEASTSHSPQHLLLRAHTFRFKLPPSPLQRRFVLQLSPAWSASTAGELAGISRQHSGAEAEWRLNQTAERDVRWLPPG